MKQDIPQSTVLPDVLPVWESALTSFCTHDPRISINMYPVKDLGSAVDESCEFASSLRPLMEYTEGDNVNLRGICNFLTSPDPNVQCVALQLLEHAAEWENAKFTECMSETFGPVAELVLDSRDIEVHCAALDTLKLFLASPLATDIVKSMIPRGVVDAVSTDLNSKEHLVQLASVELLDAASHSEVILVEFVAAVSLISSLLPSMQPTTQVTALRVLESSAGSSIHELVKVVADTLHYLIQPLSSPETTVQIAALKVLEVGAGTKNHELARAVKAIVPVLAKILSSCGTNVQTAVRKVLEAGAQLFDTETISPTLLPESSDKSRFQIPALHNESQALQPVGQEGSASVATALRKELEARAQLFDTETTPPYPRSALSIVAFKETQIIIPVTAIKKLQQFPHDSGAFSDIWKCSISTQSGTRTVAVKSFWGFDTSDKVLLETVGRVTARRILREIHASIGLKHNHILPLEGIVDKFGPLPSLVSPWMENGSLYNYLNSQSTQLDDRRKVELIQQVVAGLSYLHGKGIVHGDLTVTNILVDDSGSLRLADFGLSLLLDEAEIPIYDSLGDVRWMAPEFFEDREELSPQKPTKAGDIYSFGCVMLQILSGKEPYGWIRNSSAVTYARMLGREPFRDAINMTETNRRLSSQCLSRKPERRPSIIEVATIVGLP